MTQDDGDVYTYTSTNSTTSNEHLFEKEQFMTTCTVDIFMATCNRTTFWLQKTAKEEE